MYSITLWCIYVLWDSNQYFHDYITSMSFMFNNFSIGLWHIRMMDLYALKHVKMTKIKIWYRGIFAPADQDFAPAKMFQGAFLPRRAWLRPGENVPEIFFCVAEIPLWSRLLSHAFYYSSILYHIQTNIYPHVYTIPKGDLTNVGMNHCEWNHCLKHKNHNYRTHVHATKHNSKLIKSMN